MMLLTTCAACAKPLEHDAPAHCVNCRTRYCGDRCLRYHAHRGGHVYEGAFLVPYTPLDSSMGLFALAKKRSS